MIKILLVEDDQEISKMENTLLTRNGYQVINAYSGTEAVLLLDKEEYDIIIIDLMLPGLSGDKVLQKIREQSDVPVLCVSAVDTVETKLDVIRSGADDYMTKPFHNEELLVRIEALLRRSKKSGNGKENLLTFKDITLNADNFEVRVQGELIELTQKEYAILELLMCNPKKVFTKDNIYESVWGEEYFPEDNTVNVHVSNLRNKLAAAHSGENYIKTVWGIGFKLSL